MQPQAVQNINIIHAVSPLNEELFRKMATPRAVIKANKSTSQVQCTTCFAAHPKLQTCKNCKSVWYCSKECQKKDWPRHKTWCTAAERPKGMMKFVENLVSNVTLSIVLQACAALDLDLINDRNKEIGIKFPFMIRADLAVEPSNVFDFVELLLTDNPVPQKMEGMIQLNHFHSHIPGKSGFAPLTEIRDKSWRIQREKANSKPELRDVPIGLVEFVNNDSDFSITVTLPVYADAMKLAKEKDPWVMVSAITNKSAEKPMTVATCLEFINMHIRSDKKNELKLRTEMTETDKAIVRSVRDESITRGSVVLLREKIARESIYSTLPKV